MVEPSNGLCILIHPKKYIVEPSNGLCILFTLKNMEEPSNGRFILIHTKNIWKNHSMVFAYYFILHTSQLILLHK